MVRLYSWFLVSPLQLTGSAVTKINGLSVRPVFDLSGQGFKLIGGRLDYVSNIEVAAVVFQQGN
jgi:hypothetical protein